MAKKRKISLSDITPVKLYSESLDRVMLSKGKKHAEKILFLASKGLGDWRLVNENLEYSQEHGIRHKHDQGTSQESE